MNCFKRGLVWVECWLGRPQLRLRLVAGRLCSSAQLRGTVAEYPVTASYGGMEQLAEGADVLGETPVQWHCMTWPDIEPG
jgi:hypothetical protein